MSKIHAPLGDAFEIQVWDEIHDKWTIWSFGETWTEALEGSEHARGECGVPKAKVRIVKL